MWTEDNGGRDDLTDSLELLLLTIIIVKIFIKCPLLLQQTLTNRRLYAHLSTHNYELPIHTGQNITNDQ